MSAKPFAFRSISTRFIVLTVIMVVILFGGLGIFIAWQNSSALRVSLDSKSASVSDLASRVGAEYLANFNFIALDHLVEDIVKDQEVSFIGFYNTKGELVTKRPVPETTAGLMVIQREIRDADNAVLGTLKVGYRQDSVKKGLFRNIAIVSAGTVIAIILFSFGIAIASRRVILAPINRLCEATAQIAGGDLSQPIDVTSNDELGVLTTSLNNMMQNLNQMVRRIDTTAEELNTIMGNLSDASGKVLGAAQLQAEGIRSTSTAVVEINASIKGVAESVGSLSSSASESSSSIMEMTASVEEVALNTETLAQSVGEVSSSIGQMAASIKQVGAGVGSLLESANSTSSSIMEMDYTIRQVGKNAEEASAISENVRQDAETGKAAVEESIAGMHEIKQSSAITFEAINSLSKRAMDIGTILSVIDDVAEQTNLLALNAAIIAAQAGEQGKGFAVVAEEIKELAERTRTSTHEITQLIKGVQDETARAVHAIQTAEKSINQGHSLSERSGAALQKICDGVQKATDQIQEIAKATLEQTKGSQLIREAMDQVSNMVSQINSAAKEQAEGSGLIMSAAETMRQLTDQVRSATREQTKVGSFIARSTENITHQINQISSNCVEQTHGSERITASVRDIELSSSINLDATKLMDQSVTSLSQQIELLKEEMKAFKV